MASFLALDGMHLALTLVLSLLLPLSIFFGRGNVRTRRLAILDGLRECVEDADAGCRHFVLKELDLIRSRYAEPSLSWSAALAYVMPTILFVLLSMIGFAALFTVVDMAALESENLFLRGITGTEDVRGYQAGTVAVVAAAFLGAYVWSVNYLVLRIANFDLSPLSFLRVSSHMLLTVFLAGILRHVVASGVEALFTLGVVLGIAFLMGLFPTLGMNVLIDRLPARLGLKRPVAQSNEIAREYPLDLIEGIDAGIKFRLGSLEIVDAQNLASANPIKLYIESPYGLLRILDWIAQAQLLVSLGPEKYLKLRAIGVRDIHGFLALGDTSTRKALKPIVFGDFESPEEAMDVYVRSLEQVLHVRRLIRWLNTFASLMDSPAQQRLPRAVDAAE
ncbi:MAG TPA: hypothetical protein VMM55_10155 [Thermohalobaculum sp.]|nr:hypothetical protein [Thermohalobaculum sp.]